MLCDRDGALWLATGDHDLVHIHQGRTDVFGRSNGMSGDSATSLLEDHEGNIWVVAFGGLGRFREIAVAAGSVEQGLSDARVWSVLAGRDGVVWIGTSGGSHQWSNGQVTIARTGSPRRNGKLDGELPNFLFQDHRGQTRRGASDDTFANGNLKSYLGLPHGGNLVQNLSP